MDLGEKPLVADGGRDLRVEDFDRDGPVVAQVVR
jgi:hypothetical protein